MRVQRTARLIPSVLGIDASLTSTGYCYRNGTEIFTGCIKPKKHKGSERLAYIRDELIEVVKCAQPSLIVLEDYALNGIGRKFHIGELGGVIRLAIWEMGIPVLLVKPTQLKLLISGSGGAKKTAKEAKAKAKIGKAPARNMQDSLHRLTGYRIAQNDEVDAFGLMLLGEVYKGAPIPAASRNPNDFALLQQCEVLSAHR